jgi:preprotein translocase subunit YajC
MTEHRYNWGECAVRVRKLANALLSAGVKKGDRVVTKSGLHGKIAELNDKDNSCVIETLAGKLKFDRSAISMEMSSKLNAPVASKK